MFDPRTSPRLFGSADDTCTKPTPAQTFFLQTIGETEVERERLQDQMLVIRTNDDHKEDTGDLYPRKRL